MKQLTVSIVGAGWLGLPLARRLGEAGHMIRATTTDAARGAEIAASGATPHVLTLGNGVEGDRVADLFRADIVVFTVPPSGVDDYAETASAVRQHAEDHGTGWMIMTSSTSVYPDLCRTVTEDDAGWRDGKPLRRNGAAILAAEEALRAGGRLGTSVLRLAGLYGYGRHPARHLAGRRDLPDGDAPVNLVHRDDAIAAIEAILLAGRRDEVFNVCADAHPRRRDYFPAAARALGLDLPSFADGAPSGWKIVSSERLKQVLGFTYRHPDPLSPAP